MPQAKSESVVLTFCVPSIQMVYVVPEALILTLTVPAGVYVSDATLVSRPSRHLMSLTEPLLRISAAIQLSGSR